jgi:hypothetical protein
VLMLVLFSIFTFMCLAMIFTLFIVALINTASHSSKSNVVISKLLL